MFPPCGTTGAPAAAHAASTARDLGAVGRADHRAGVAVEAPGPVGLVAGPQVRVDEHVGRTDDVDERVEERVGAGHVTYGDTMRERVEP